MKIIISLLLALALLTSVLAVGAVGASAAETSSAPSWRQRNDKKIYFYADPVLWKDFDTITLYLYSHKTGDAVFSWGNKKGKMTDEGNHIWSYDCDAKGLTLPEGEQYGVIFTADWVSMTADLIFDRSCLGDMAYPIRDTSLAPTDSYKLNCNAAWVNADRTRYGMPLMINSMGEVVGDVCWSDQTPYDLLTEFLAPDNPIGVLNAVKYNGKTVRQTADYAAAQLGLSASDLARAAEEAGVDLDDPVLPSDPSTSPMFLFYADPAFFGNPQSVSAYIYTKDEEPVYPWGSNEWEMTQLNDHYWLFACSEHNVILNPFKDSYVIITVDGKSTSNVLTLSGENHAQIITPTGRFFGGLSDDKREFEAKWQSAWDPVDSNEYFPPNHYVIPGWEKQDDGKLYFFVGSAAVHDFTSITCNITNINTDEKNAFYMECEGNGVWSLDLSASGYDLGEDLNVYLDFDFEWGYDHHETTTSLHLTPDTLGDLAIIYLICRDRDQDAYSYKVVWYRGSVKRGDVDGDGVLSIEDATILQQHLAEFTELDGSPIVRENWPTEYANADCNCDGVININDVTAIQRVLAEFDS